MLLMEPGGRPLRLSGDLMAPRPVAPGPILEPSRMSVAERGLPLVAALFLIGLIVPLILHIGPLRLSAYRLVLVIMVVPCLALWLTGRAGRWLTADFCILGIALWSAVSLFVLHDTATAIEPAGVTFVETTGAWFLARCFIRTPRAFRGMVRLLFLLMLILLPAAVFEALTGRNIALEMFGQLGPVFPDVYKEPRMGLDRVQGPFEHPILFGVFCGSIVGLAFYVLGHGRSFIGRAWRATAVVITAAGALSAGPLTALVSQSVLIGWDRMLGSLRGRWALLAVLFAISFLTVDLLSNRTPFHVFASYFSFNAETAYNRIRIWEWGTRSIFNHPGVGIGLNDWERPYYMSSSVDMFWIAPAMRHGVPVWILYFAGFFAVTAAVARRRLSDRRLIDYRTGYLVSMAGFFVVGWTVHFWNATFVLFLFLLGSGAWLASAGTSGVQRRTPDRPRTLL